MTVCRGDISSVPSDVVVQQRADGVRYILPCHRIGRLRWLGLVPLTAGLAVLCWWYVWVWLNVSGQGGALQAIALGMIAIVSPLIVVFVAVGLFMLGGHNEIAVRGTTLYATEAVGPFHWTRRRPIARIARFTAFAAEPEGAQSPKRLDIPALIAEGVGIRRLWLMVGYPRQWTIQIGEELSARCSVSLGVESGGSSEGSGSRTLGAALLDAATPPHQPASHRENNCDPRRPPKGSAITVEDRVDGFTLTVPRGGSFCKASRPWLIFASVLLLMDGMTLASMLAGQSVSGNLAHPLPMALIAVGAVGMLFRGWQLGRRQTRFEIRSDTLTVTQVDPLVRHQWQWQRAQLLGIGRSWEDSRSDSKDSAMLEIRDKDGRSVCPLRRHDPIEVDWLVQVLLRKLR